MARIDILNKIIGNENFPRLMAYAYIVVGMLGLLGGKLVGEPAPMIWGTVLMFLTLAPLSLDVYRIGQRRKNKQL